MIANLYRVIALIVFVAVTTIITLILFLFRRDWSDFHKKCRKGMFNIWRYLGLRY